MLFAGDMHNVSFSKNEVSQVRSCVFHGNFVKCKVYIIHSINHFPASCTLPDI